MVDVQGHRGARGLRPENTRAGFELAAAMGVQTLELDLHLTADDQLLVWHDPQLTPDKCAVETPVAVRSRTLAELRAVVCDRNPDPERFSEQVAPAGEDFGLMSLDDVLTMPAPDGLRYNIELKRDAAHPEFIGDGFDGVEPATFERQLVAALQRNGVRERATVQSFDHRSLWAVHRLDADLELAALTVGDAALPDIARGGAAVWSPNYDALTADAVAKAHALDLRVVPWTVNDESDIQSLLAMGVDGIISDRPDLALAAVQNFERDAR